MSYTLNKKFMSPKVVKRIDTSLIKDKKVDKSQMNISVNIPTEDDRISNDYKSRNFIPNDINQQKFGVNTNEPKETKSNVNLTARKHRKYLSEINAGHIPNRNEESDFEPIPKSINTHHNETLPKIKKSSKIVYQGQTIIDYVDLYPLIKFEYTSPLPQAEDESTPIQQLKKEEQISKKKMLQIAIQKARPPVEHWKSSLGDKLLCFDNINKIDIDM